MYYEKALDLAKKINDTKWEIKIQSYIAENTYYGGNLPQALTISLLRETRGRIQRYADLFYLYRLTHWIYSDMGDDKIAFEYVKKMNLLLHSGFFKDNSYQLHYQITNVSFSMVYTGLKQWDSALYYQSLVYKYAVAANDEQFLVMSPVWIGDTYSKWENLIPRFIITDWPYQMP